MTEQSYSINLAKRLIYPLVFVFVFVNFLTSCVREDDYLNTNSGNMEALWTIMDEHYCFFDLKEKELGVNWDEVHNRYKGRSEGANSEQLFEVLANMIGELRDGHVNLYSGFDIGRNWSWKEEYPKNFSEDIIERYIGTDYHISSGIIYTVLDDNIGYMRVSSFASEAGNGNLDNIIFRLLPCRSLIIDVRENGGGLITAAEKLASRFTDEVRLVGYMQHKTGKGHNDFSKKEPVYLTPSTGYRWTKQVFVLSNRGVYSAANEFVKYMKECPMVTVIGDSTGGGAGMPFSSELPNGWGVRFSACPMYDVAGNSTEHGIAPDIYCEQTDADYQRCIDTLIEKARSLTK